MMSLQRPSSQPRRRFGETGESEKTSTCDLCGMRNCRRFAGLLACRLCRGARLPAPSVPCDLSEAASDRQDLETRGGLLWNDRLE